MQAMQSSKAWESGNLSGQFAALRHVTRTMRLSSDVAAGGDAELGGMAPESSAGSVAESAGLAHDAGNLLGALGLYSDLLALPGVLHEEYRGYAAELRLLSERSWAMINRLVNHAKAERAAGTQGETVVLPEVVERCRGLLNKVAGRPVAVTYGERAFDRVGVSAEAVERIVTNLVKNAAEATPWVGAISVSVDAVTRSGGDDLRRLMVLTVRDRGCGMDASTVESLMRPGGVSSSAGRGLGFRVVRELVAMSGGCLSVESEVDVGTSISVEWYAIEGARGQVAEIGMQRRERLVAC